MSNLCILCPHVSTCSFTSQCTSISSRLALAKLTQPWSSAAGISIFRWHSSQKRAEAAFLSWLPGEFSRSVWPVESSIQRLRSSSFFSNWRTSILLRSCVYSHDQGWGISDLDINMPTNMPPLVLQERVTICLYFFFVCFRIFLAALSYSESVAGTALWAPSVAHFVAGTALREPRNADFVAGAALREPSSAEFAAGAALCEPGSALFVAGAELCEPQSAPFVAGAALCEVGLQVCLLIPPPEQFILFNYPVLVY